MMRLQMPQRKTHDNACHIEGEHLPWSSTRYDLLYRSTDNRHICTTAKMRKVDQVCGKWTDYVGKCILQVPTNDN